MKLLTFLSDFGTADWYVAAVKGVILARSECTIVDISHEIEPGNVKKATFFLQALYSLYPPNTIHLAIVDPGVGTDRRIIVTEYDGYLFIAPDNGLLTPFVSKGKVFAVDKEDIFLDLGSNTFHGRDRFAPVAAYLLNGNDYRKLGYPIDNPKLLPQPILEYKGNQVIGEVVHIDRFGNVVTNIPGSLVQRGGYFEIKNRVIKKIVDNYQQIDKGELAVVIGSLGTAEISMNLDSAASIMDVQSGDKVIFRGG